MRHFIIVFLIFGVAFSVSNAQENDITFEKLDEPLTELQEDYVYVAFDADSKHLAWVELYQPRLFVHDLSEASTEIIPLSEGRGPGEYLAISDLEVMRDNIFLSDPNNNKLLKVNIFSKEKKDIPLHSRSVFRITQNNQSLYLLENVKPDVLVSSYNLDNEETLSLNEDNLDIQKEFDNPFFKDGVLLSGKNHVYFVEKYRPQINIFNINKRGFEKQIIFDDSEVETIAAEESDDGVKAMFPPTEVDILIEDAVILDAKPNSVFLLARGKGSKREYRLDELHEYDLAAEEFVANHDLVVKAEAIAANNRHLFVYSEDENKVFQYKITGNER